MPGLQLTYEEFVNTVRMSKSAFILVEGSQDKQFFDILLQTLRNDSANANEYGDSVAITTAEGVKSDGLIIGNRSKVENLSELVAQTSFRERFVGFVDRESREFHIDNEITDNLRTQRQIDRLVWSRGHSIENYLFDFQVVRIPFRDSSENGQIAETALQNLEANFAQLLSVACALGLAGAELGLLEIVRGTVHIDPVMPPQSSYLWNVGVWKNGMVQHSSLNSQQSDELAARFEHWLGIVEASKPIDVRWTCDGHIGIRLVWAAYAKYVYLARQAAPGIGPNATNQRDAITKIPTNLKFNYLARSWAQATEHPSPDTPYVCFELIGVTG